MWELRGSLDIATAVVPLDPVLQAIGDNWLITATLLVFFMQAGFLLLEAGSVRSKNTINVAQKNITDLIVCSCVFLLFGGSLMLGQGSTGFFGFGGIDLSDHHTRLVMLFQLAFCATAATIVSGAVAERMHFSGYIVLTVIMAGLTYPLFAHLAWGNTVIMDNPAFLSDLGFLDFAGSTIVHVIGGSAALAATIFIGARSGRFSPDGKVLAIRGHSSVLSSLGVVLLMIGWIGFNAGTSTPGTDQISTVIFNTVVAMAFGGAAGLIYSLFQSGGKTHPRKVTSGILGGLVAITAGCAYVDHLAAALIGLTGGLVAMVSADILLHRFKIDDPVDAIAIHGAAGAWGTLVLAFLARDEFLTGGVGQQFLIQLASVASAIVWSFGLTWLALKAISAVWPVRVSSEEEELGLNMVEHEDGFDLDEAIAMLRNARREGLDGDGLQTAETKLGSSDYHDQVDSLSAIVNVAKASRNEVKTANRAIEYLATRDHLTELNNRESFSRLVEQTLAEQAEAGQGVVILYLDLDGFKAVNDGFGHATGDEVLRQVSRRLMLHSGPEATIARFGGDEFVIAIPLTRGSGDIEWREICHRLIAELNRKVLFDGNELYVGVSIGVALFPQHATALDELLNYADMALYDAKAQGKGCWVSFEGWMKEKALRRRELEADMRAGLHRGEFHFQYQPQISIETGRLKGFEALMRWDHPRQGSISPMEFIPVAESSGFITELTEKLLLEAFSTAASWPLVDGIPCKLSVNISPVQLRHSDIVSMLRQCLEQTGLQPTSLEIEITESMLIENKAETSRVMLELRQMGIDIAIDDFGTGYSSLSYLQELPVSRLKVDRSFVRELEQNVQSQQIARSIVELGKSLGLNVIAEGVETEPQKRFLADVACDDLQGYLYSPPVSAQAVQDMIEEIRQSDIDCALAIA